MEKSSRHGRTTQRCWVYALAGLVFSLQACVSTSGFVSDDKRSKDGKFDGKWTLEFAKPAGLQYLTGNWEMTCGRKPFAVTASVKDGVMQLTGNKLPKGKKINVGRNGQFRAEWPLERPAKTSSRSANTLAAPDRKMILQGKLGNESASGLFTVGIKEFNYLGCNQNVKIERG